MQGQARPGPRLSAGYFIIKLEKQLLSAKMRAQVSKVSRHVLLKVT
ncbi:hypothetical protein SAMN04488527_11315 [Aliiroseovarius crassostreae]|nr:hypothetical protein SAMN04488527_11315 [Aliiroseovarius crassostreae]